MAVRATAKAVTEVVEWQDGNNGQMIPLASFINQANIMTDWLESKDTDSELSVATLTAIEVQLAAHFYAVQRDSQYQSKATAGASGSRTDSHSIGFEGTPHGLTALRLDFTGNLIKRELESRQGKRVVSTTWLGHIDHSEDPYS